VLSNLNPNSIIVIDRDRDSEGKKLKENAQRVVDNFSENKKFAWVTGGREIENYIHPDVLKKAVQNVHPEIDFKFKSGQFDKMINPINQNSKFDKVKVAKEVVRIYQNGSYENNLWDLTEMLNKLVVEIEKAGNKH